MASNTRANKRGREDADDRTESTNKKAKVEPNKLKTFFVLTEDKENLNNDVLSFENNYLNLPDLTKLSNAASVGLAKTIRTKKLQAVAGMSQQDFEAEEKDWRSTMQKVQDKVAAMEREAADSKKEVAELKKEAAELKKEAADSKKKIADLEARVADLEAAVASYSAKLTQYEIISPHKKK